MKGSTFAIIVFSSCYAIAITLMILSCVYDNINGNPSYWNLLLLLPFILTPGMTVFIRSDSEQNDFWSQFAVFIICACFVSCFAIPSVFYSENKIGEKGLVMGLTSSVILLFGLCIGGYTAKKDDY